MQLLGSNCPCQDLRARPSKASKAVTNCPSVQWRVPERSGEVEGRPATAATTGYLLLQQARSRPAAAATSQQLQHQTTFFCPHCFLVEGRPATCATTDCLLLPVCFLVEGRSATGATTVCLLLQARNSCNDRLSSVARMLFSPGTKH